MVNLQTNALESLLQHILVLDPREKQLTVSTLVLIHRSLLLVATFPWLIINDDVA
jgi:hypothetical protein